MMPLPPRVIASRWSTSLPVLTVAALALCATGAIAQEPLHQRIDAAIATSQTGPVAGLASDAEFIRRVSLDLVGTIPTSAEVRAFLAEASPDKRTALVERLVADPRFALHWAEVFDTLLMERRPDKHVPHAEWIKYLQASLVQNKPWNQLVREIMTADGTDPALRPAAKFFLDRDAEPHILTRDVGRIFFGVDLQCAQCHNHPLVDHYLQSDYYGLYAFANRTVLFNDETAKQMQLGEKAEGDADYQSVFTKDASRSRPRLPGGTELEEPHLALGDEYVVAPADKVRPVPKYSRRAQLAKATEGGNGAFDRNLPNRLWAQLFGRGLVHPVDWNHPHNPPVHPQVLDALTQEFVSSGYNIQHLIRQIVLSQTYQRSLDPAADPMARVAQATEQLPPLQQRVTELEAAVKGAAEALAQRYTEMKAARDALVEPDQAYQKAIQAALALKKPFTDAQAALAATQQQITAKQTAITALTDVAAKGAEAVKLLPNDAEVAQATTVFQNKVTAATTELTALQKTATDQTAAVAATQAKWQEGVAGSEAAYTAYTTAAAGWEQKKLEWQAARTVVLQQTTDLEIAVQRRNRWQQSAELAQQVAGFAAAQAALPVAETELKTAETAVVEQQSVVTAATTALATTTQEMQVAQQQLEAATNEFANRQATAKPVVEAVAATEAALQKLPNDVELTDIATKLKARLAPLTTSMTEAEAVRNAKNAELQAAASKQQTAQQQMQTAQAEMTARQQMVATKVAAVEQTRTSIATAQGSVAQAKEKVAVAWEQEFDSRIEKQLTPEQMTYALLSATGVLAGQRAAADAEVEKTIPKAQAAADPAQLAARERQVEQLVRERMRGNVNVFVNLYGGGAGQPQDQFFATADQALFLANNGTLRSWINPSGENLSARLLKLEDTSALADELYVSTLCRPPTSAEAARVAEFLTQKAAERPAAIQELVWAVLTSAEFRFNL